MKTKYHIYHLPNAYRRYENYLGEVIEVHGKVGYSKQSTVQRRCENSAEGLDVTGHEVIAWARTKEEALLFEQQYQVCYECKEPKAQWVQRGRVLSDIHRMRIGESNSGKTRSVEIRSKLSTAAKNRKKK